MARVGATRRVKSRVKASRARRGDFNIVYLIPVVIGVLIAVAFILYVYLGGSRILGSTSVPAITASEVSEVLTVNIKDTGVGSLTINGITLYSGTNTASSCSVSGYYLNGQSSSAPPITIKPGDTYTVIYSGSGCGSVTTVQVMTDSGAYTAAVT